MKIVKLTTSRQSYACLVCGEKDNLKELALERDHSRHGSIIGFTICVGCVKQMSKELSEGIQVGD